ncbi:MAG: hypothetical protein AMJ95_08205 [Omnitrophica WOR_2 bacterium SM23_72]|nr:MAG: hypothetical protein AMJ95_08205 [Omnitrophica WOR_2 bacterium SM23_72]
MEVLNSLGVLLGGSWASGVNLYMTVAGLGIAHRMHWITLPGKLDSLSNLFVISVAIIMYLVEFVADKVPYFDSAWDTVHTFIRPLGGAALGYMSMANMGPAAQIPVALLTGTVAMDAHLTKATTRAAINTSPEPVTNSIASVTEDVSVFGVMYLIIKHPIIASILVILFIVFSIWFLKKMFRFLVKVFRFFGGKESV